LRTFVELRSAPPVRCFARAQPHFRCFAFWDSHGEGATKAYSEGKTTLKRQSVEAKMASILPLQRFNASTGHRLSFSLSSALQSDFRLASRSAVSTSLALQTRSASLSQC